MEYLIIWLAVAGAAGLTVLIVRSVKRHNEAYRESMVRMGMLRVEKADPSLVEKVQKVEGKAAGKVRLRRLYKREESNYTLYITMIKQGNDGDESETFIMEGRGWRFPSMSVVPYFKKEGALWGMLNKFVKYAGRIQGYRQIESPIPGAFSDKYMVLAKDESEVRVQVPRSFWEGLMTMPETVHLKMADDLVIYSLHVSQYTRRPIGRLSEQHAEAVRKHVDLATRLGRLFQEMTRDRERV